MYNNTGGRSEWRLSQAMETIFKICKGIVRSLMKVTGATVLFPSELYTLTKEAQNSLDSGGNGLS